MWLLIVGLVWAQKAAVTEVPVGDQPTTITVQKGAAPVNSERDEIVEGSAEIVGDPQVLEKAAREAWKKACDSWKAEVKDLNKNNSVIALNCNSPKCGKEGAATICKSLATYKVKVNFKK